MSEVPFEPSLSPAEMLQGLELDGGWTVVRRIPSFPGGTGGSFSTPYVVEREGKQAFLKAIDFTKALSSEDPARALEELTRIFNFERDLVQVCSARKMRNVVEVVADGTVTVPNGGAVERARL